MIRPQLSRKRLLAVAGLIGFVAIGVVIATDPFSTGGTPTASAGNGTSTSLVTVTRESLSAQTQVNATLGYAAASNIVLPGGSGAASVLQAQQSVTQAEAALQTARAGLAADTLALERAQATLRADRAKQAADCRGAGAAEASGGANAGACATDHQTVGTDEQGVTAAVEKVAADKRAVSAAEAAVPGPATSYASARSSATFYDATSTYTMLPAVGQVVRAGQALFAVDGKPCLLLYGSVTAWRAFVAGMSSGPDVAELNTNLRSLGYGNAAGDTFSSATRAAIMSMQHARGLPQSGELLLGAVTFKPGAVRVTSVQATLGGAVQPGAVLAVTSTARQVTISLDAAQQAALKVGDKATITMPDNSTTPGVVSEVGSVATTPSSDPNAQNQTPTVDVQITPTDPAATGRLDQAPVQVSITTASVENALVVPVNALLALAGGGYAVETVDAADIHKLVAVGLGLFDDSQGLVELTDTKLVRGQRVVVPAS
ncbi:MAG TPA: peptidoglycan-binding protein [Gaiellaceae bacterium]|nr:peptidoglycan-binding protein [Gaiellaceae bacterium]